MKKNSLLVLLISVCIIILINQFGNYYSIFSIEQKKGEQKVNLYRFFLNHYVKITKYGDSTSINSYDKLGLARHWVAKDKVNKTVYLLESDFTNSDGYIFYIKEYNRLYSIKLSSFLLPSNSSYIDIVEVTKDTIKITKAEFEFPGIINSRDRLVYFYNVLFENKNIHELKGLKNQNTNSNKILNYSEQVKKIFIF